MFDNDKTFCCKVIFVKVFFAYVNYFVIMWLLREYQSETEAKFQSRINLDLI